ncbi:DUF6449 domain-containing protein [Serpentinicella sp. ANB-PHB4]|uniref:DUF6449 domain-containing protein n=1 Tax=Serpentinicella sp. ANB-PHB4 TaxID=3074076 RepID=UPI002860F07B|nr:DUF6449 domain-containing protein [Serpentinicella sp. ANB-PHB4]MDR5658439.1 DUF6449 domain-containing protein [Serpentinicella sp. ANB-PHB4]
MKSITSYFSKGIIRNEIKRLYWVPILYFIALFLTVPLQIIMEVQRYLPNLEENLNSIRIHQNILYFNSGIIMVSIFTIPVVVGLLLFRYLQNKDSSDMIHSLPIKREGLFISYVLAGIGFIVVPILLTGIIILIIRAIFDLAILFTVKEVFVWIGTMILANLIMFASTVFVGTVTGITVAQGILTYIVLLLPVGLYTLVLNNMTMYLFGFNWESYERLGYTGMERLSPIIRLGGLFNNMFTAKEAIAYSVFILAVLGIGLYIYKERKLENNLQVIVFNPLKIIFKYGVTFCVMLVAGLYFYYATDGNLTWVYIGYITFSLLGYLIAEGILQKSVRIFTKKLFVNYAIYGLIITILVSTLAFDVVGFEGRIPTKEEIQGVYLGPTHYSYERMKESESFNFIYREEENIERILNMHQTIIDNKWNIKGASHRRDTRQFHIVYELNNGENFVRTYSPVGSEFYEDYYEPLVESKEHKINNYPVLNTAVKSMQRIQINSYTNGGHVAITDPDEIKELVEALRRDILEADYETIEKSGRWGDISILLAQGEEMESLYGEVIQEIHTNWSKNFKHVDQWLEEKGYLNEVRLTEDQVAYIVVEEFQGGSRVGFEDRDDSNTIKRYETSDKIKINEALKKSGNYHRGELRYQVGFYDEKNNMITLENFFEGSVPQYVEDFFN